VNSLQQGIVFHRSHETTWHKRQLWIISFIILSVVHFSCGFWPSKGRIVALKGPEGLDSVYGIVGEGNSVSDSPRPLLIVLPTGFERRRDVVRDLEGIWAPQATTRGWVIVCPASSQGLPFGVSRVAGFGLGAERLIPYLLKDLRNRGAVGYRRHGPHQGIRRGAGSEIDDSSWTRGSQEN